MENKNKISACLVVYNEEKVIERCLQSIKDLVDEIIIVHDGPCTDRTIEIAKKYTDKIFVRNHVGMMEGHLVFAFNQTTFDWILRIDADEFFEKSDIQKIKELIKNTNADGIKFKWEMWNGSEPVHFQGLEKLVLFRKDKYSYCGIPHEAGVVKGKVIKAERHLHHQPAYNNISWFNFFKKKEKWVSVNAQYFFYGEENIDCFNCNLDSWVEFSNRVKNNIFLSVVFYPLKVLIGQLKNGLWKSWYGINLALQQYVYYLSLYIEVWKIKKKLK